MIWGSPPVLPRASNSGAETSSAGHRLGPGNLAIRERGRGKEREGRKEKGKKDLYTIYQDKGQPMLYETLSTKSKFARHMMLNPTLGKKEIKGILGYTENSMLPQALWN